MTSSLSVLYLLMMMTADMLLGLDPKLAQFRREGGTFINSPEATLSVSAMIPCAVSCTAMRSWFCGGFTYYEDGTCALHRGNEESICINPLESVPPLEVDTGSEPRSYRRLQPTCPGDSDSNGPLPHCDNSAVLCCELWTVIQL